MLSESMGKALNSQISAEMHSADLYFDLACEFAKMGLMGFSHWCVQQWSEENDHALKIATYIHHRDGNVEFERTTAKMAVDWECPCEAMKKAYEHEKLISDRIGALMTVARAENDYSTESFLTWFVDEQVEEEATLMDIISKLEIIGEDSAGLIHCDTVLHQRPHFCCS